MFISKTIIITLMSYTSALHKIKTFFFFFFFFFQEVKKS